MRQDTVHQILHKTVLQNLSFQTPDRPKTTIDRKKKKKKLHQIAHTSESKQINAITRPPSRCYGLLLKQQQTATATTTTISD